MFVFSRAIEGLPASERTFLEQWFDYHIALLQSMPESQRFYEYARAQLVLTHLEQLNRPEAEVSREIPISGTLEEAYKAAMGT